MSSDARVVFFPRLTAGPPGSLVFHNMARRMWDRTECGRVTSKMVTDPTGKPAWYQPEMVPCRRDIADLIGRPCAICRWRDW